jgi:hypothetical protein
MNLLPQPLGQMESAACFQMLVPIYQITWHHIPGDHKLQVINWKNVTYVSDLSILKGI